MVLSFTAQSILSRWLFLNGSVLFLLRSFHTCTVCPHNSSSSPQKSNSAFCLEWGFPSKRDGHSPLTDTAGCSQWSLSLIHYHKIIVPELNFYRWFETLSQRKKKEKRRKREFSTGYDLFTPFCAQQGRGTQNHIWEIQGLEMRAHLGARGLKGGQNGQRAHKSKHILTFFKTAFCLPLPQM